MNEKELLKSYHNRSPFININHKYIVEIMYSRSTSTTSGLNTILTLRQLNQETQKLALYFDIMNLEDTFENYKRYMLQKQSLMFLEKIQSKILDKYQLKKMKRRLEEM